MSYCVLENKNVIIVLFTTQASHLHATPILLHDAMILYPAIDVRLFFDQLILYYNVEGSNEQVIIIRMNIKVLNLEFDSLNQCILILIIISRTHTYLGLYVEIGNN